MGGLCSFGDLAVEVLPEHRDSDEVEFENRDCIARMHRKWAVVERVSRNSYLGGCRR